MCQMCCAHHQQTSKLAAKLGFQETSEVRGRGEEVMPKFGKERREYFGSAVRQQRTLAVVRSREDRFYET